MLNARSPRTTFASSGAVEAETKVALDAVQPRRSGDSWNLEDYLTSRVPALDLSRTGLPAFAQRPLSAWSAEALRVLILAGSTVEGDGLCDLLRRAPNLMYLDLSCCGLSKLPPPTTWTPLWCLEAVLIHHNKLRSWEELVSPLAAPALTWFSAFNNPISDQPEYRLYVLKHNINLLLIDSWIVTDDERLEMLPLPPLGEIGIDSRDRRDSAHEAVAPLVPESSSVRFSAQCRCSEYSSLAYGHGLWGTRAPGRLYGDVYAELQKIRKLAVNCSAVLSVQTSWRGRRVRRRWEQQVQSKQEASQRIQKWFRGLRWKLGMVQYTREHLAVTDSLDLLLSASELLRRNALKIIRRFVKTWRYKRNRHKTEQMASLRIGRWMRGHLTRNWVFVRELHLNSHRRIYFSEFCAWEFLVLLNVVQRWHGLPTYSRSHSFEVAEFLGLYTPEIDGEHLRRGDLHSINMISKAFVVRPRRCGRFPQHPWDGPMHTIRGGWVPSRVEQAMQVLRRRGCNSNTHWRLRFQRSCATGPEHPIDLLDAGFVDPSSVAADSSEPTESLILKTQLDSVESHWEQRERVSGTPLGKFYEEARRVGARPCRRPGARSFAAQGATSELVGEYPLRSHRRTCWTAQRLLYYECPTTQHASDLLRILLGFGRDIVENNEKSQVVALPVRAVRAPPFIPEYLMRRAAAATAIQAAFRARLARAQLPVSLRMAVAMRRAALCIQRGWRWGLLKRRLAVLCGAVRAANAVRTTSLFLEERTYTAINVLNGLERYPPFAPERRLAFGWRDEALVFVSKAVTAHEDASESCRQDVSREQGLPRWVWAATGLTAPEVVPPDDQSLKRIVGTQGLLMEGALTERCEDNTVTVQIGAISMEAHLAYRRPDVSLALCASGGIFRFIEVRYTSLAQAKLMALAFFLCVYNTKTHITIPFVPRGRLEQPALGWQLLRVWDSYQLTWSAADRVAPYQLKVRGAHSSPEVPLSGRGQGLAVRAGDAEARSSDSPPKAGAGADSGPCGGQKGDAIQLYVAASQAAMVGAKTSGFSAALGDLHLNDGSVGRGRPLAHADGQRAGSSDSGRPAPTLAGMLANARKQEVRALEHILQDGCVENENELLAFERLVDQEGLASLDSHRDMKLADASDASSVGGRKFGARGLVAALPPVTEERGHHPNVLQNRKEKRFLEGIIQHDREAELEHKKAMVQAARETKAHARKVRKGLGDLVASDSDVAASDQARLAQIRTKKNADIRKGKVKARINTNLEAAQTCDKAPEQDTAVEAVPSPASDAASMSGSSDLECRGSTSSGDLSDLEEAKLTDLARKSRHCSRERKLVTKERGLQIHCEHREFQDTLTKQLGSAVAEEHLCVQRRRQSAIQQKVARSARKDAFADARKVSLQALRLARGDEVKQLRSIAKLRRAVLDEEVHNRRLRDELQTVQLAARHGKCMQQRRIEVDALKAELRERKEQAQRKVQEDLETCRRQIEEQKAVHERLMHTPAAACQHGGPINATALANAAAAGFRAPDFVGGSSWNCVEVVDMTWGFCGPALRKMTDSLRPRGFDSIADTASPEQIEEAEASPEQIEEAEAHVAEALSKFLTTNSDGENDADDEEATQDAGTGILAADALAQVGAPPRVPSLSALPPPLLKVPTLPSGPPPQRPRPSTTALLDPLPTSGSRAGSGASQSARGARPSPLRRSGPIGASKSRALSGSRRCSRGREDSPTSAREAWMARLGGSSGVAADWLIFPTSAR
eukprot:TRINITY_DN21656_c0_g1_i1.p1 TRINITY_DN21656_c0_g1~~TRINITY_DN21656_c0_g1_i1.p1  ORF type:complete len:1747 (+),score=310.03 TRINITY_DN21656_c0_g1_i1:212-5452(+)